MESSRVDLGFAEECAAYLLSNRYFPSKIGGKPAWLDLKKLPTPEDLQCDQCQQPMSFLCQVYAPIETDPEAFHRTIFLFVCRSETCYLENSAQNLKAFRSQLRRENDFYSSIAPDEDENLPAIEPPSKLCQVCGCLGPLKCSKCKAAFYCSKSHQCVDWKNGHKEACGNSSSAIQTSTPILLPAFSIEIESDKNKDEHNGNDDEEAEKRRLQEYENLVKDGKAGNLSDVPESEIEKYAVSGDDDKTFKKFKKKIADDPEQVLRYERGGRPLLIADPCSEEVFAIPDCEQCGSKRIFEFQVMPQLLNYLKDDILDWGTIFVYSCSKSCATNSSYIREHVVKQDIVAKL